MSEYVIREASYKDIHFLADVVIEAEKGMSNKLSYSTLFNVPEDKVKDLIVSMFEEEIDGCELSVSSFFIAEYNAEPVAAFGGWIESLDGSMPSKVLKSNLISYTFGKECIAFLITKAGLISDLVSEREPLALQLEYLFVSENHRGKKLSDGLIQKLEENARLSYPALEKAQVQVFKNNISAIKVYQKNGFKIAKSYKANDVNVLQYLPFDEKYVMEKVY